MTKDEQSESVLRSEGIRRLLEDDGDDLTDDERALVLAFVELDGRELGEQERAALDRLKTRMGDYDTDELAQAVERMVTAKPIEERKLEWPELKGKRRRRSKKG